LGSRQAG